MEDIVCRGLRKAYGSHVVLDGVSLRFPAGAVTAVMAPSGAGKTTLLRLIAGLEKPDAGVLSGTDGTRFGFVFQEDRLLPWGSALGNVRFANGALSRAEILRAMEEMDLAEAADQPAGTLSGGMARRVALLRALLAENDVLLLDEPFKGMDPALREKVTGCVLRRRAGRTLILVTHEAEEAEAMGAACLRLPAPAEAEHGG